MPKRREGPTRNKQTGYYFFDEYVGIGDDKKRIRVSLRTKDPEKARWLWEREFRKCWSEYYGEKPPATPFKVPFKDLIEEFIDYERDIKRIKEWKTAQDRLNIVLKVWGNITLDKISKEHLIKLDEYLQGHRRSKATVNHYFGLLKTFFNYAIRENSYSRKNPINEITPYTIDTKRREYTPEEIERILKAAERVEREARKNSKYQKYIKRIILLLFYTGMRIGEVLNLKWENIQGEKIVFKRSETKQKKEKVIPLTDKMKDVLDSLRDKRRKDGYVIPLGPGEKERGEIWMTDIIKKIKEYSGIQDFIFHNIRHTASTIMISEALGRGVGLV